ncbi:selenoprotein H-like [Gadus chalcogrammus]|uniref:selenoprotein H-like n=1 Tax=Gadus chalcogrammus TaxID=1042646 RepID=UPI0024C4B097|nr:selenoprotein H-like [Gadus chalcogrammus]
MAPKTGRRGTKRKADAVQEEEEKVAVELKESKEEGVKQALLTVRPELNVVLNPEKPRRKSFEITLVEGERESILWTGIKKGPPARLKFPEPAVVVAALEEALEEAPEEAPVESVKTE